MLHSKATLAIDASCEQIMELLTDLKSSKNWHPAAMKVEVSKKTGIGSSRIITFTSGKTVKEILLEVGDRYIRYECEEESTKGLQTAIATITVDPGPSEDTSQVTYEIEFEPEGVFGLVKGVASTRSKYTKRAEEILEGIQFYIDTGKNARKYHFTRTKSVKW